MEALAVADRWFERTKHPNGVTQLVEPHLHRMIRCNIWHVRGSDKDLIIDTGVGVASVSAALADLLDRPVVCVATHFHYDHVGCFHEFDERLMHPAEALDMDPYQRQLPLVLSELDATEDTDALLAALTDTGYVFDSDMLLDALPAADFDPHNFTTIAAAPTATIEEGDTVDLGDRRLEVLHLPGHTQGSIGLWEASTRTLFSGAAIYDGPLIDMLPESSITDYVETMKRLHDRPADIVHAGHDPSFGPERLREIARRYLDANT